MVFLLLKMQLALNLYQKTFLKTLYTLTLNDHLVTPCNQNPYQIQYMNFLAPPYNQIPSLGDMKLKILIDCLTLLLIIQPVFCSVSPEVKENMHQHHITILASPQNQNPYFGGHESYNFNRRLPGLHIINSDVTVTNFP